MKFNTDYFLNGLIYLLVAIVASWVTMYFHPSESTDSSTENQCNQPTVIVIKETINVINSKP